MDEHGQRFTPSFLAAIGLIVSLVVWSSVYQFRFDKIEGTVLTVGSTLAMMLVVWLGRIVLDGRPTPDRATWVTACVHFGLQVFAGTALILAVALVDEFPSVPLPLMGTIGVVVMAASAPALVLTVVNLAAKGLGAPFAISLTERLATSWMYAWSRNPMALSAITFLTGLGLYYRSWFFLLWTLGLFTPAMLVFLSLYEERELEVRFGTSYLEYRDATPMIFPKKPAP